MKVLKQLTLMFALLLLQACLPDSFTKFKEEPAVNATEEGASGGGSTAPPTGPCPFGTSDEICEANPATIFYSVGYTSNLILIDRRLYEEALGDEFQFFLEPNITFVGDEPNFNEGDDEEEAALREEYNRIATYTITPALPAGLGIVFDANTGVFRGVPKKNYSGTHVVEMEFLGAVRTATVELILSDTTLDYLQENEHRLKIKVSQIEPFVGKSFISTIEGKRAEIIFVDKINRTLYVKTTLGDDLVFDEDMLIDNRANFLSGKATIENDPVFVFGSSAIDGNLNQAMLRPRLAIATVSPERAREYQYTMLPSIAFTGLIFQQQSACYDVSSGDVSTFVQMPDFTACEVGDPDYLEISGGTVWGQILPSEFPIPETPFQIQAQDTLGNIFETSVSLEFAPFPDDLNFSLSQDIVAKLLKTSNFVEGDFISDNSGARGVVKEIIPIADPTYTYAWITVQQGTFVPGTTIDNKPVYQNARGTISEFSPVNAKLETDNPIPAIIEESLQEADGVGGFITAGGSSARLVLRNGNFAYIRVSSRDDYNMGNFATGNALGDQDGNVFTAPAVQVVNVNGQHLRLTLLAAAPATLSTDANLIYSAANDGSAYEGAMYVRKVNSLTDLEVEMTKGDLGVGSAFLRFGNPVTTTTTTGQISAIATNSNRFVAYKDFGFKTIPFLEQSSEGTVFAISPTLPPGLTMNQNTGEISGVPQDRADQSSHIISMTNALGSRNFEIILEVKDYIGLTNKTANASSYILHKTGMGNEREPCIITRDQFQANGTAERDIECVLDTAELDLFQKGISLDFTLGNDMCQFYRVDPYYFARFEVPDVSALVNVANDAEEIHSGEVGNALCADGPKITVPGDLSRELPAQNKCTYDYSTQIEDLGSGFNCDVRDLLVQERIYEIQQVCPNEPYPIYDATTCGTCTDGTSLNQNDCVAASETWNAFAPEDMCAHSVRTYVHECGGDLHQCVAGAGEDLADREDIFDTNIALRGNAEGVEKITTNYIAPATKGYTSNKHLANFKNINSCLDSGGPSNFDYLFSTLESGFRSNHPYNNGSGTIDSPFIGNPYYTYLCLDAANNVQARIRLVVREWNESFRTSSNIDYIDPDTVFGARMETSGPNDFVEETNSFFDWETADIDDTANSCNLVDGDFPGLNL